MMIMNSYPAVFQSIGHLFNDFDQNTTSYVKLAESIVPMDGGKKNSRGLVRPLWPWDGISIVIWYK